MSAVSKRATTVATLAKRTGVRFIHSTEGLRNGKKEARKRGVSVVSWNMLLDKWAQKEYYPNVKDEHKAWDYRRPRIESMMCSFDSDIICLQECNADTFFHDFNEHFLCREGRSYQMIGKDERNRGNKMRPVTLFDSKCLTEIYTDYRSRAVITLFRKDFDIIDSAIDDENKAMRQSEWLVLVNVHLEGDPMKWESRYRQMKSVFSRMHYKLYDEILQINIKDDINNDNRTDWLEYNHAIPMIICGDFNEGSQGLCHRMLKDEMVKIPGISEPYSNPFSKHLCMEDLYQGMDATHPTFNGNQRGCNRRVDFIYLSTERNNHDLTDDPSTQQRKRVKCTQLRNTLEEGEDPRTLCLPNTERVSDHLPIAAVIEFERPLSDSVFTFLSEEFERYSLSRLSGDGGGGSKTKKKKTVPKSTEDTSKKKKEKKKVRGGGKAIVDPTDVYSKWFSFVSL